MSTILGADGKPVVEPETAKPVSNGQSKERSEVRDVRTVPTGVVVYNLMLTCFKLEMNKMTHDQMMHLMQQQKMIVDPPEVVHIRAAIENLSMARDVMMADLNARFKDIDEAHAVNLKAIVEDRIPPAAGAEG